MIVDLEQLDRKRRLAGLTRVALAKEVGVVPLSISRFLNGQTCSIGMVRKVCDRLGVEIQDVMK